MEGNDGGIEEEERVTVNALSCRRRLSYCNVVVLCYKIVVSYCNIVVSYCNIVVFAVKRMMRR